MFSKAPSFTPVDADSAYQIQWNDLDLAAWEKLFAEIPQSNLLQSWPYAQMMRQRQQMKTRFGRFTKDGETLALFQVHEVKLGPLYHVVTLDRGPLWLDLPVSKDDWAAFALSYAEAFPKRLGRRRRFMPELETSPWAENLLKKAGFVPKALGYQSIWLDLGRSQAELRANMKGKWRNKLNQSERRHLSVRPRNDPASFSWLMQRYAEDRRLRRYRGPSVALLRSLYSFCAPRGEVFALFAAKGDETVAGILVFRHGTSATYQVGWTSEAGRALSAHQFLLWHGITQLKSEGCSWFDLGGIHPEDAEGVTRFKRGLGGVPFQLVGIYS